MDGYELFRDLRRNVSVAFRLGIDNDCMLVVTDKFDERNQPPVRQHNCVSALLV